MTRIIILTAATMVFCGGLFLGQPAKCQHCVPTFCGTTAECPGDCVCAIPNDRATGTCMGTR